MRPARWLIVALIVATPLSRGSAQDAAKGNAAAAHDVLKTHCFRCHGENGSKKGGLSYILDRNRLVSTGRIIPGKAADSPLFQMVRDGAMPPKDDKKARPGKSDLAVLEQWIAAGAPALDGPPPPRTFVSEADLHQFILTDLQTFEPRHRRFLRYFTLTHLANAGLAERNLQIARLALAKLVNSLSFHPRLTLPRAVDPGKTVFRIDLREVKWNARLWERVLAFYPYRLANATADARAIAAATGTELAHLRADWFLANASRPPLYHDLLQLPSTDRQLERLVQVDVLTNLQEETVVRAGFTDSGVSKNNRLIERHDAAHGAYWRSYDFADNRERQNLFKHPLGPPPAAQDSFLHAGGEIIFHLPNGLQGYLLVDANGRRIDQAPVEVVSDPKRPDRKVDNGLSCMSCHVRGLIPKSDQVRAHVLKNPQGFSKADFETVKTLYPADGKLQGLLKEDNQRFEQALRRLRIAPEQEEPITLVVQRYEGTLDLTMAAAEVGLPPAQFAARLERSPTLSRLLGALRAKGGTVSRDTFEAAFTDPARELEQVAIAPSRPLTLSAAETTPFTGHLGPVVCVAVSPDGRRALSGSDDRTVRLWDLANGRELRRLEGHTEAVTAVAFSADGRLLVSGSNDRSVRVWDAATGRELHRFPGLSDQVRCLAVFPGGRFVLIGSRDGTLRLWDPSRGSEARSFEGHAGSVNAVAFSADGRRMISGGADGTVRLWDTVNGKELHRMAGHTREVFAVALSPDGRNALSGGNDKTVRLWAAENGRELRRFDGHANAVIQVAFTSDGRHALSASSQYQNPDRTFRVWDLDSGRELAGFAPTDADRIGCAAFTPDGQAVLTGSSEPALRLWKLLK